MTIERLRAAAAAQPFKPFTLHTADGRAYTVTHPEFLLLSPKAERTFVIYDEQSGDPEDYVILDLLLVAAIEFSNGRKKRRSA